MRVTGRGKLIGAVARRDKRRARNFALFSSQAGYLSDLFKPSSSSCRSSRDRENCSHRVFQKRTSRLGAYRGFFQLCFGRLTLGAVVAW